MKIKHIMKDGTVRDSIEGIVIQNEQFYDVLRGIIEAKENAHNEETSRQ